jgi:hypothetical protein
VKRELQHIEIPGEYDARRRTWAIVREAYSEREPVTWPRRHARELAFAAAAVAVVAAAVTPPGRSVVNSIRDAVGREKAGVRNAQRELVGLPAPGRLLVQSPRGAWIVQRDGSRRLLGRYKDASWSPHGLFVAGVLHGRELVTLDPKGTVRWEKPHEERLAYPRWSYEGFRIAYLAGSTLRVIVGNGTGDRLVGAADARVAPAWRPGTHEVAYLGENGWVRVVDADARKLLWRTPPGPDGIRALTWSDDGSRLLVLGRRSVSGYLASGRLIKRVPTLGSSRAAAFAPGSHRFALTVGSNVLLVDGDAMDFPNRPLFTGAPALGDAAWSPNGRWLLIGWPAADQLVFVRVGRMPKLDAVSNVSRQFLSRSFPGIAGWTVSIA